jgi:hypothetical protein
MSGEPLDREVEINDGCAVEVFALQILLIRLVLTWPPVLLWRLLGLRWGAFERWGDTHLIWGFEIERESSGWVVSVWPLPGIGLRVGWRWWEVQIGDGGVLMLFAWENPGPMPAVEEDAIMDWGEVDHETPKETT